MSFNVAMVCVIALAVVAYGIGLYLLYVKQKRQV